MKPIFPRCTAILGVLLLNVLPLVAETKPPVPTPDQKLRVVTRVVEPFVIPKNGKLTGYSIDLWNEVAARAHLQFEYQVVDTVPEMLQAIREGKADVGVAALTINAEREQSMDFSYPIYQSGLKIAVRAETYTDYFDQLGTSLSPVSFRMAGLLIFAAIFTWIFRKNRGLRICFAIFASLTVVVVLGSILNGIRTMGSFSGNIKGMSDLPGQVVGTLEGTTAADELKEAGVKPKYYFDLRSALGALQKKEVDAVVYDAPVLAYLVKEMNTREGDSRVELLPALFNRQAYGFAMKDDTGDLRRKVNLALLSLTDEGVLKTLDKEWFGDTGK